MDTEYDTVYIAVDAKHPDQSADAVKSTLTTQAAAGWRLASITPVGSDGLLLALQRPTPPSPTPTGSLGGYGT